MEALVPVFEKFGPTGLTIVMMGGGLVYLTRWLRANSDSNNERHDKTQERFLNALDSQRKENHQALQSVVQEFKGMHADLKESVDELASKVDQIRK